MGRTGFAIEILTLGRHRRLAATRRSARTGGFAHGRLPGCGRLARATSPGRRAPFPSAHYIAVGLGHHRFFDPKFCLPAVAAGFLSRKLWAGGVTYLLVVRRGDRLGFVDLFRPLLLGSLRQASQPTSTRSAAQCQGIRGSVRGDRARDGTALRADTRAETPSPSRSPTCARRMPNPLHECTV